MNTTISLVESLRGLPTDAQQHLLQARLTSVTGIRDWFDVADALLQPEAIDRGLAKLTRTELEQVAQSQAAQPLTDKLVALGLGSAEGAYPEVAERARAIAPAGSPGPVDITTDLDERVERACLEQAVGLVSRIEELIELMKKRGLRTVSRGSISAADSARVAAAVDGLPADLSGLLELMRAAGLVELSNGIWSASECPDWNTGGIASRWQLLAAGWLDALDPALVEVFAERSSWGSSLSDYLTWLFPIDASVVMADAERALAQAEALGMSIHGQRTRVGLLVATGELEAASETVSQLLPAYIDQVLIQSDLTVVSPGPLRPDLEAKLRAIATVESRSIASTYRLNASLISRAMDTGTTVTEIEEFLREVSSTGIPQPVAYLISDVGAKHATIRVRSEGRGSIVTCSDASLAARLQADFALRALGLTADTSTTLLSPHDVSVVMRNLHAEKYPAALENETGEIQPWELPTAPLTGTSQSVNAIAALIERLSTLATPVGESDDQWLVRQLEVAIRNRTLVTVSVALPDGSSRDFLIDPRGLSNGRFRGLDRKSEVERTLPLSSITGIKVAEVA
jgi:hypothetical protein